MSQESSASFAALGVPQPICAALAKRGINKPFAIQAATIADALAGRDVCGRAPTGSGKTLAFGIPLVVNVGRCVFVFDYHSALIFHFNFWRKINGWHDA